MAIDLEAMIARNMKALDISREEAIALIASDAEIDRMTSAREIDGDLTPEQRKNAKGARQADRKPTVFKFDTSKRKRTENTSKRFLMDTLLKALKEVDCADINLTNVERELTFTLEGVKYKLTLSAPRS